MKTQTDVILYITAQVVIGNKGYIGRDLWPVFKTLCNVYKIERTMEEVDFATPMVSAQRLIGNRKEDAQIIILRFTPSLMFAKKPITV